MEYDIDTVPRNDSDDIVIKSKEKDLVSEDELFELFASNKVNLEQFKLFSEEEDQEDDQRDNESSESSENEDKDNTVSEKEETEQIRNELLLSKDENIDSVGLYLKEMSLVPLLSNEEEIEIAKRIELANVSKKRLNSLNGNASFNQKSKLLTLIEDGEAARAHLIKANTRLVVSIAKRYIGRGVPFLDLIQEGNLGLMKAVSKFDYHRGFRFSTYATWWIRQTITRSIADQGRTIRIPVHMIDRIRQMYKVARQIEQDLGRPPQVEELAEALDVEEDKVQWMLRISYLPLSLESPVGDDEDSELGMFVEDENSPTPTQTAYHNLLCSKLDEVLETLSPREARILRLRFGLENGRTYTLEEVGEKFGLTRERIRQIEGKALKRLRHPMRARQLRDYL